MNALLQKEVSFSQDVRPEREYLVGNLRRSLMVSAKQVDILWPLDVLHMSIVNRNPPVCVVVNQPT
jgi:hypothetical protein